MKTHKDVEYAVEDTSGHDHYFRRFDEAAAFALTTAMSRGTATLDVIVSSVSGARHVAGSDGVEQYKDDPEASVFDRYEISVNNVGRVP